MKIEDYLPKTIMFNSNSKKFYRYDSTRKIYDIYEMFFVLSISKDLYDENTTIIKYYDYNKYYNLSHVYTEDIYLVRDRCENNEDLFRICMKNFNEKIGNPLDFVDSYEKRNLILKDLICY